MDWLMNLDTLEHAIAVCAGIAPVIMYLCHLARKSARRVNSALAENFRSIVVSEVAPINSKIEQIFEQITVNGNTRNTLRDKIGALDESIHLLTCIQRANLENSMQPRFECDATGKCVWVNEALSSLFGLSVKDMTASDGKGWLTAIEQAQQTYDAWMEAVNTRVPYRHAYTVNNQRTGKSVPCVAVASPLYARDGKTVTVWNGSVNPI